MDIRLNLLNITNVFGLISYYFLLSIISREAGCVPTGFIKLNCFVNIFQEKVVV